MCFSKYLVDLFIYLNRNVLTSYFSRWLNFMVVQLMQHRQASYSDADSYSTPCLYLY